MKTKARRARDWRQKQGDLCECAIFHGSRNGSFHQCENRHGHSMIVATGHSSVSGETWRRVLVCGTHRNLLNRGRTAYALTTYNGDRFPHGWMVDTIRLAKEGEGE